MQPRRWLLSIRCTSCLLSGVCVWEWIYCNTVYTDGRLEGVVIHCLPRVCTYKHFYLSSSANSEILPTTHHYRASTYRQTDLFSLTAALIDSPLLQAHRMTFSNVVIRFLDSCRKAASRNTVSHNEQQTRYNRWRWFGTRLMDILLPGIRKRSRREMVSSTWIIINIHWALFYW